MQKSVTTANKRKTTATAKSGTAKHTTDEEEDDGADQSDLATRAKRMNIHQVSSLHKAF